MREKHDAEPVYSIGMTASGAPTSHSMGMKSVDSVPIHDEICTCVIATTTPSFQLFRKKSPLDVSSPNDAAYSETAQWHY
jgi:hypothetical protein